MNNTNKSYRIRTNINEDAVLNVKLDQDYDTLDILSIKMSQENVYRFRTSNYGVIVGRVLANGGFGIPNAKVSVFIQVSDVDINDPIKSIIYPFNNTSSKNSDGIKYNLLPDYQVDDCYRVVGTMPNKRLVLDDTNVLEVYNDYYKFTTTTNQSGDYMLFGVPTGNQTIHVDLDLSDIGILSQRPRDLSYKGYNIEQFENPNQFKKDTNLDSLSQLYSQDKMVYVHPFWGDTNDSVISISRNDIQIQYKIEPTCIFMGCAVSDDASNGISKKCIPTNDMGRMKNLVTGNGTIEMIRKTQNNLVEEIQIKGTQLIDGNGVWCYQIPMNLDYIKTDEFGNIVPSDDPDVGIPTRTRVRFRISLQDFDNDYTNNHRGKVLVPNNPKTKEDMDYTFGSATLDDEYATKSFRDLFWNNVYTVKSFIPRIQKGNSNKLERFSGIKSCNIPESNNPIPYNNIRLRLPLMFIILCAIIKCWIWIVRIVNKMIGSLPGLGSWKKKKRNCIYLGEGMCPDMEGWYFAPGCSRGDQMKNTLNKALEDEGVDPKSIDATNNDADIICLTRNIDYLIQCVEINLAQEYEVINFDFYNDWINGMVYIPRWNRTIRKKRSYLFGLIKIKPKIMSCSESSFTRTRKYAAQCALAYKRDDNTGFYTAITTKKGCSSDTKSKCHKGKGRKYILIFGSNGGVVHEEKTSQEQSVYYFKPCDWINGSNTFKCNLYATDIVLLGSLNDCDRNGIPQAFKELTSSTYQMPTNLALTNMSEEGYMYGISTDGSGGSVCNNGRRDDEGVKLVEDSFTNNRNWSKDRDFEDLMPEDDTIPITEASGIDWGYSGPGQDGNDIGKLYFPGGHFLGISCVSSEVNIKSCVNLSRICEQGVWMSQRQAIPKKYLGDGEFRNIYISPNGLISKDEISDTDFRSSFATLNFNSLKTKYDNETGYLKYDFQYLKPLNFEGSLKTYMSNALKNDDKSYFKENIGKPEGQVTLNDEIETEDTIRRSLEDTSTDYLYFRLGMNDNYLALFNNNLKDAIDNRYLSRDGNNALLPVYENSYYFYFGLIDGSTAIDEFIKQFYSTCPSMTEYVGDFSISTTPVSLCGNEGGKATITINEFTIPYRFSLYLNGDESVDVFDGEGDKKYIDGMYIYNATDENGVMTVYFKENSTSQTYTEETIDKLFVTNVEYNSDTERIEYYEFNSHSGYTIFELDSNQLWNANIKDSTVLLSKNGYYYKDNDPGELYVDEKAYLYRAAGGNSSIWNDSKLTLHNLPIGTHIIKLIDADTKSLSKEFTISAPSVGISLVPIDFRKDCSSLSPVPPNGNYSLSNRIPSEDDENDSYIGGYFFIDGGIIINGERKKIYEAINDNDITILITTDSFHICSNSNIPDELEIYAKGTRLNWGTGKDENGYYMRDNDDNEYIKAWEQGVYYNTYILPDCGDVITTPISIGEAKINGAEELELCFGSQYITSKDPVMSNGGWCEKISTLNSSSFNGNPEGDELEAKKWALKKAFFYTEPFQEGGYSLSLRGNGGEGSYTFYTGGRPEIIDDAGNINLGPNEFRLSTEELGDGYFVGLDSVSTPTWNYKINNENRLNFRAAITDGVSYIPQAVGVDFGNIDSIRSWLSNKGFEIPVMYRPFFFESTFWLPNIDVYEIEMGKLLGKLYNGITITEKRNETLSNYFGECFIGANQNSKVLLLNDLCRTNNDELLNNSADLSKDDFNKNGPQTILSDFETTISPNIQLSGIKDDSSIIDILNELNKNGVYYISFKEGTPQNIDLTEFEINSTYKSLNAIFYDSINYSHTENGDDMYNISVSGSGTTKNVSYYVIKYDNDDNPYAFPFSENVGEDNLLKSGESNYEIFSNINDALYKELPISSGSNNGTVTFGTSNYYIIGINNANSISSEEDLATLNKFSICKLYGLSDAIKPDYDTFFDNVVRGFYISSNNDENNISDNDLNYYIVCSVSGQNFDEYFFRYNHNKITATIDDDKNMSLTNDDVRVNLNNQIILNGKFASEEQFKEYKTKFQNNETVKVSLEGKRSRTTTTIYSKSYKGTTESVSIYEYILDGEGNPSL